MPKKNATSESSDSTPETAPAMTFEHSLKELEQIVIRLESGELALEDALNEFERGIQLARQGQQTLQQAEQRVQILLNDDTQSPLSNFSPDTE
ncbi:exodeoxyribonuclease VII small subunit [Photorhabdus asymbiotica]|uniref:exodeoxyribonuclease VII small subunit n=1 Tax=Photorhabdus asymbiotica TaxID=291112 RepID=UPI003DA71DC4